MSYKNISNSLMNKKKGIKKRKKTIRKKMVYKKTLNEKRKKTIRKKTIRKKMKGGSPYNIEINSIYLAHRILLIASIENNNFMNKDVIFTPVYKSGQYIEELTDEPIKQSFAFEYSTGISNRGENFPNTFLPIMHIESVGKYLQKSGGLEKIIEEQINEELLPKIIDKCRENSKKHLFYFMKRFGCWKELQISAALGGETWDIFTHFKLLQDFALTHDFIHEGKLFILRTNKIQPVDWFHEKMHIEGMAQLTSLHQTILEFNNNNDRYYFDNLSINKWLNINNVLTNEKLLELSKIIAEPIQEKSFYEYQLQLFVVSNIEDVLKEIIFPSELVDAYTNNKPIINKVKDDIPLFKIKKLYQTTIYANENNEKLYESYKTDLENLPHNAENVKYIPFLKYKKDEKMYEISGTRKYDSNIEFALQKAHYEYPEYEENKFNWKICS